MISRIVLDDQVSLSSKAQPGPPRGTPPKPAPPPPPAWRRWLLPVGLVLYGLVLFAPGLQKSPDRIAYSDFVNRVSSTQVKSVSISDKGAVSGTLSTGAKFTTQIPTALTADNSPLEQQLLAKGVQVTGTQAGTSLASILVNLLPLLLLVGFFVWTGRRAQKSMSGGIFGVGKSKARISDVERPTTRFSDVAGHDGAKQEIGEVVDFLRHPERYRAAGAQGPRGVLMVGPPGTGKTLLARAVAGEADVPFLSESGSAFVEMFVGVGAARVRDLFVQARKRAPSIIFIDEIDAIGGKRGGVAGVGTNDEREQTLNQLLAEMDGFDETSGVVVLAATNRPEILDAALLRAGRFDRQVAVGLPNQKERTAILAVHARGKHLDADADLSVVARGTPGFSGADLANLINEAAINAVRVGRSVLTAADLDAARDRILLGRRDATNALLPDERHSVAVHEAGHALVAVLSPDADPVAKVTILPAGMALGVTQQLPEAEHRLYTEAYLTDSLTVRLGGRAAELVVLGQGSTGAANDLAGATALAERMVREFGLSPALGPVGYASDGPQYLGGQELSTRSYSSETQRVIDEEVARLLREAETRAIGLLTAHRVELDRLTNLLIEEETVDGDAVHGVLTVDDDRTPLRPPAPRGPGLGVS